MQTAFGLQCMFNLFAIFLDEATMDLFSKDF